jgi:hypothetical protein
MIDELVVSKTLLKHQYDTMKVKEIQEYYGICSARFYKLLKELGIDIKVKRSPPTKYKKTVIKD